jgi:penicillin amidase
MNEIQKTIVDLLKGDATVDAVAESTGLSRTQISDRKRRYLRRKLPKISGTIPVSGLDGPVEILRDNWGVAHVEANCVADGFFGLGYAMAQDRLWQLDHMRRLASGRLAEILGPTYVDQDRLHRTIGLRRCADAAFEVVEDEVRLVLESLSSGINAHMAACKDLPVEFDLLGYAPEPWTPNDSVAVWKWRWWMLTGRLNILAVAEAGRKHLSDELFRAFMTCEASEEIIVPGDEPASTGGHDTGEGSNNWVVGGSRTESGKPILATDPHNSVDLSRQWYQAQLTTPGMDAIGAFFLGTPGIYLGHTRHTAWGVTNHTASARDVYVESEDAVLPDPIVETICVADGEDVKIEILSTDRGPLVQDFVPGIDRDEYPLLSLKWNGSEPTTGFESML